MFRAPSTRHSHHNQGTACYIHRYWCGIVIVGLFPSGSLPSRLEILRPECQETPEKQRGNGTGGTANRSSNQCHNESQREVFVDRTICALTAQSFR